eukprot:12729973-Alexandrium_andersonii.AAC.1
MEVVGEAEGTNGQRLMVRIADKRGQRAVRRLVTAGRLRLQAGYTQVPTAVVWKTQALSPPGLIPGQAAFQAACRLRSTGLGPKGTAALLIETRPADESGRPLGANTRYISAGA